jgi:hypothetical protein
MMGYGLELSDSGRPPNQSKTFILLHPPVLQPPLLWQPAGLPDAPVPQLPHAMLYIIY